MKGHGLASRIVRPPTAAQRVQIAAYAEQNKVTILPADAGLPRWSWWAAPWPEPAFYALAAVEAPRMAVSKFGRWLEPPLLGERL